jgi:thiamine pyrophosphokinase
MKAAIIFLKGVYRKNSLPYYRGLCKGKTMVAANGGSRFFVKCGIRPDLIIGDLDSAVALPIHLVAGVELVKFPPRKDKTDSQLALEYCLENGARSVDLVMPDFGQPDHYLGNLMLLNLSLVRRSVAAVRVVSEKYQAVILQDNHLALAGCKGDLISVLPVEKRIELTCEGMEYEVNRLKVRPGETVALRNQVRIGKARMAVRGRALVIHQFIDRK